MDIHPPAGAIRSIREYLLHLSMVVLGILIALGLEQWREARVSHAIARRALDDMLVEIRENRADVARAAREARDQLSELERLRDLQRRAIEAARVHARPPPEPRLGPHTLHEPALSTAAWDNALAMQALGRIDFDTARRLARAYTQQREVKETQRSFVAAAIQFETIALRPLNDTPERMRERLGAVQQVDDWMNSLSHGYDDLLKTYDALIVPTPPAAASLRP